MSKAGGPRWPIGPGQPKPRIPPGATERVTKMHEGGGKATSEFWSRGRLAGRAFWDSDGSRVMVVGLKDGEPVGHQLEFHDGDWTGGRLDRGFPRFFVGGKRVSKPVYLKLAERDPSLPPYRADADLPVRILPERLLQLRQRARRIGRSRR